MVSLAFRSCGHIRPQTLNQTEPVLTIVVVIENPRASAGGHRLGVLGVAVDTDNSIL